MSEPVDWEDARLPMAARAAADGEPTRWFDELYAAGASGRVTMPWSRDEPHPLVVDWVSGGHRTGDARRAVVVGCGLGADAEYVAGLGYATTAFDISPTAIELARERHPESRVDYTSADLLALPLRWRGAFDLVVEVITVQALPDSLRPIGIAAVSSLLAPGGTLLVVAAVRDPAAAARPVAPWPLTRAEIDAFATEGVTARRIEQVAVAGQSGRPRWRAEFRRTV